MNRAFKVVLLLVAVAVLARGVVWFVDSYPFRMKVNSPDAWRGAEMVTVEAAIESLMFENGISDLSMYSDNTPTGAAVRTYASGEATNDMSIFPSAAWRAYPAYSRVATTKCYYTVELDGTVRQFADAAKTVEYGSAE